jgi:hypothetical protein
MSSDVTDMVAFMGQVPVKVRGSVALGDYIVASGLEDGTAVAVPFHQMNAESGLQIVGRAWSASDDTGIKLINTAVGLPEAHSTSGAMARTIEYQRTRMSLLESRIEALESLIQAVR